jgi:hypothetical protein
VRPVGVCSATVDDAQIRTMLATLVERVADIELAAEPQWASAHFVCGVEDLPVRYRLR